MLQERKRQIQSQMALQLEQDHARMCLVVGH